MSKHSKILSELDISADLVYNTHAKKVVEQFYSEDEKETASRQPKQKTEKSMKEDGLNQRKSQESLKLRRRQRKRRVEKTGISIDDMRKLDKLYLNGPASFGSAKRLQNLSNSSMKKIKMYLEMEPSFNKCCSGRIMFPRLKFAVNDINEIWSVDLAYVDTTCKIQPWCKIFACGC